MPQSFQSWFLFLLGRTQQKTDQMRAEDPVEKIHGCSTSSSAKANGSCCSSQQWQPCRRVCDCLSNSYRPRLFKFFGRGPHKLLHNSSRARYLVQCDFFVICYILPNKKKNCKFFGRGPHKLLHNSSRARHLVQCDFFGVCYILRNQKIFCKYIILSSLVKFVLPPGDMASQVGFVPWAVVRRTLI